MGSVPNVTTAVFLAVLAVMFVTVGVYLIVQLDGALVRGGGFASSAGSGLKAPGSRAQRRAERKASPVLFILSSVLVLLVIATLV